MTDQPAIQHILTPETEKHFFTDQILPPLLRGESVTVFMVPSSGVKKSIVFLQENSEKLGFDKLGKHKIFYISPYGLLKNTPEDYFQLMIHTTNPKEEFNNFGASFYFVLEEGINEYLLRDFHLIFVLPYLDKLHYPTTFFNNLQNLYLINKNKIHFIFIFTNNIFGENGVKVYDQLGKLLQRNIIYFPLLSPKDTKLVADRLNQKYNYQISESERVRVQELSGGHPSLIKHCLALINKRADILNTPKNLVDQPEVKDVLQEIWESFTPGEKDSVSTIVKNVVPVDPISNHLLNLRLVKKTATGFSVFSPLFEIFVKKQGKEDARLIIDQVSGQLLVNGLPIKKIVTLSEFRLLSLFLSARGNLFSRDQIAEALWGKDSFNRYSDWAIDQAISLLRKKIAQIGIDPRTLQTIKGRGYRWVE